MTCAGAAIRPHTKVHRSDSRTMRTVRTNATIEASCLPRHVQPRPLQESVAKAPPWLNVSHNLFKFQVGNQSTMSVEHRAATAG